MTDDTPAFAALAYRVRREMEMLAYPRGPWVQPRTHVSGERVYDVVVVGGGQSGLAILNGLQREGIDNIVALDRAPQGYEGPWESFARMGVLRTPKFLVGTELSVPSLSIESYFTARYGREAWDAIDRVPRTDWMDYLRWYRATLDLPVVNEVNVTGLIPKDGLVVVEGERDGKPARWLARRVVLATGYDGCGEWGVPGFIADHLPIDWYAHSNGPIDFARLAGKRIGVLGHGASAFDNAAAALRAGAASVDLCFRRQRLPLVNPHRWIEYVGFLKHFPELRDLTRWRVNLHFKKIDQPPAKWGFEQATAFETFRMHAGCPWNSVRLHGDAIEVTTPRGAFAFDFLICATGSAIDFELRPELSALADEVARWQDRFTPSAGEEHPTLGRFPYLDAHYAYQPRTADGPDWCRNVYAFNFSGVVSMGPHSTSVSGHKYSIPRLLHGLTRSFFLEQENRLMMDLEAYDESDLDAAAALMPQIGHAAE